MWLNFSLGNFFLFAIIEAPTFHLRKNSISDEWQLAARVQTCDGKKNLKWYGSMALVYAVAVAHRVHYFSDQTLKIFKIKIDCPTRNAMKWRTVGV